MNSGRRSILLGGVAAIALAITDDATAFLGHRSSGGVVPSGPAPPPAAITTRTFVGTSGSSENTPMFAVCFKPGQIPAGTAPVFKTPGGATIPFSMSSAPSTWPDGSMSIAAFGLVINSGVPGSTYTVQVTSGGTAPSPSSRTTADFTAGGLDLNVTLTGQDNLNGVWTSSLAQGITAANADNYVHMDGAWGKVWRIRASFRQSGVDHGYLEGYWFVAALQDGSGNLAGIRHLTKIAAPWIEDHLGPTSPGPTAGNGKMYYSFTGVSLNDGVGSLVDFMNQAGSSINYYLTYTLTWAPSAGPPANAVYTSSFKFTPYNIWSGLLAKVTSSGLNLTAGNAYFLFANGTTNVRICTSSSSCVAGTTFVVGNTTGGPLTMQLFPYLTWGSALYTAQTNGRWNYSQGAGSAASDSTIRVQFPAADLVATRLLPPYDLTIPATAYSSLPYTLCGPAQMLRYTENTGDRGDIGMMPGWCVDHLYHQSAAAEINTRASAYSGSLFPVCVRSKLNHASILALNNTTYSNMPPPSPSFSWQMGFATGMVQPTPTNIQATGVDQIRFSHMPNHPWYAFLFTGEPQWVDMLHEWGNNTVGVSTGSTAAGLLTNSNYQIRNGGRNIILGGTTYYAQIAGGSQQRSDAWAFRQLACAAATSTPENSAYNTYFRDIAASNGAFISAWLAAIAVSGTLYGNYIAGTGFWAHSPGNAAITQTWTQGYTIQGLLLLYAVTLDDNIKQGADYIAQWFAHTIANTNACAASSYQTIVLETVSGGGGDGPPMPDDNHQGTWAQFSWTSGSTTFTSFNAAGNQCQPGLSVNDTVIFSAINGEAGTVLPPGLTAYTPYYVASASGPTTARVITLSASPSLSPLVSPTGTGGGYGFVRIRSTQTTQIYNGTLIPAEFIGPMNYAVAMGFTKAPPTAPPTEWATSLAAYTTFMGSQASHPNPLQWFATSYP